MIIEHNIPLANKTWFQTGGPARYFAQPSTPNEFKNAITFAQNNDLNIFLLGHGANTLVSDQGFDGLVIRPQLRIITIHNDTITADAGVSFHDLITYCLNHNLVGIEEFSGIPGTVGGSVYINIHYFEFLLDQFLTKATIINRKTNEILKVDNSWFCFGYNQSKLQENKYYLVNATFKLKKVSNLEAAYSRGKRDEIIRHRNKRYPREKTCGSFFRNFTSQEIAHTAPHCVAYYLDKVGVKDSLRVGGACISPHHANMIVNKTNASSDDIIKLARSMQQKVYDSFSILPQPECRLIGFKQYPLIQK